MANKNSRRRARAEARVLARRKLSDPNYQHYNPPPKKKSKWKGQSSTNVRSHIGAAWPKA